ncbi:MAG: endo-1,4-beta-xylanase [Cyanobacteriota bacterium]
MAWCERWGVLAAFAPLLLPGPAPAIPPGALGVEVAHACSSLSQAASRRHWFWGSSFDRQALNDAEFVQLVKTHASVLVPENALKWTVVNPVPGIRDLSDFTAIEQLFGPGGMRFRGHPLVWHEQLPEWLETATPATLREYLRQHITWLVGVHRGRIHSWDVVNEPLAHDGQGLRASLWLNTLGPGYIAEALRWARAADPDAQLVINDYGLEGDDPVSLLKRQSLLQLVRELQSQGAPLDAIGLQAHLHASAGGPTFHSLAAFLAELRGLGLKIVVTELDVNDQELLDTVAGRDQRIAEIYRDFLMVLIAEPAVEGIMQWGLSDRYSWLNHEKPRRDHTPQRPLPFDRDLQPKAAFEAICAVLALPSTTFYRPRPEPVRAAIVGTSVGSATPMGGSPTRCCSTSNASMHQLSH